MDVAPPRAPKRAPGPSTIACSASSAHATRSVGATTRQKWSTLGPPAPTWPGIRSMMVPPSTLTEGNGASPRRHSSTRSPASPRTPLYQPRERSTSPTTNTAWSNPVTCMAAILRSATWAGPQRYRVVVDEHRAERVDVDGFELHVDPVPDDGD